MSFIPDDSILDKSAFAEGSTPITPIGAEYNDSATSPATGQAAGLRASLGRGLHVNLRNNAGTELGTSANPLKIDPSGATTQPVSGTVSVSGTVPVSGTFWQATQPVSAASLPLPSGAATAAKQPALGTAGASSSDVLSIQGVASMTPVKVDGSAVTQPVSGTFWQATQPVSASALPLPTGAATAAKQPALGTAGAPSVDVLTVQGAASMVALKVDGSAVTQPVSVATIPTHAVTQSGTWTVLPGNTPNTTPWLTTSNPTTTGGLSAYKAVSAASTNAATVKASAGQVYNVQAFNTATSARYLKVFNKATAPTVGTDVPVATWMVPANSSGFVIELSNGLACASGIAIAITAGMTDTDSTAVGANEVVINIQYK